MVLIFVFRLNKYTSSPVKFAVPIFRRYSVCLRNLYLFTCKVCIKTNNYLKCQEQVIFFFFKLPLIFLENKTEKLKIQTQYLPSGARYVRTGVGAVRLQAAVDEECQLNT